MTRSWSPIVQSRIQCTLSSPSYNLQSSKLPTPSIQSQYTTSQVSGLLFLTLALLIPVPFYQRWCPKFHTLLVCLLLLSHDILGANFCQNQNLFWAILKKRGSTIQMPFPMPKSGLLPPASLLDSSLCCLKIPSFRHLLKTHWVLEMLYTKVCKFLAGSDI